jgi:hypothetical protein
MGPLPQLVPSGQPHRLGQRSYRARVAYLIAILTHTQLIPKNLRWEPRRI